MVGQELWKKLKNLVSIDKKIRENNSKREISLKIINKDQIQIPQIKKSEDSLKANIFNLKKELDLLELDAKSLKSAEKEKRETLDKIQNSKEFKALERELKNIEFKVLESENSIEDKWVALENFKNDLETLSQNNIEKLKQLNESIHAQEAFLEQLSKELKEEYIKKEAAKNKIPKEWLAKYEKMQNKTPNPIVPVNQQTCNACFYPVLRQDMAKLKAGGVMLCRNCYRFLYYDADEEKNMNSESF